MRTNLLVINCSFHYS